MTVLERSVTVPEAAGGRQLGAWLALDASMSEASRLALGRTGADGGIGLEAWFDVTGHFADPAAQGCRARVSDVMEDRVISYTPAEAIAFCQDQFVVEALTWVEPKPSPVATLPAAARPPDPPSAAIGGTFPGLCPGESTIRDAAPCVAVALVWGPAPGPLALFRIYESWSDGGSGSTCPASGSLVYTTGPGASYASFALQPASTSTARRCLWVEAANVGGTSMRALVEGDFTRP